MFLYGDDFQYKDDNLFLNIEDLMNLIKTTEENNTMKIEFGLGNNETINFFYSTPEKYFNSIKNELMTIQEESNQNDK